MKKVSSQHGSSTFVIPVMLLAVLVVALSITISLFKSKQETQTQAQTAVMTPTVVSPTYYCGGACPTTGATQPVASITQTVPPGTTESLTQAPMVTNPGTTSAVTLAPCEQTQSVARRRGGRHHQRRGGNNGGLMQGFMQFLIQLINQILQMLGLPPLNIPTAPGGQNPQPTQTPGDPNQPTSDPNQPAPTAPCEPQPTQPGEQPTQPAGTTTAPTDATQPTTPPSAINPPAGGPWTLIANMSDEFDGTAVDTNKWSFISSAESDCEGDGKSLESGCRNPGNQQMEFNWGKNCTVANGILTITAKKETHGSSAWTSCMLHSVNKAQAMYMEARVKMPATNGFWPGFWTWEGPQNEVDVFEYYTEAKQFSMTNHTGGGGGCEVAGFNPTDGYHVYAADISSGGVKFYIDGQEKCTSSGSPQAPVSILLDLFVHDRQTQAANSVTMETDYIRAWKK